MLLCSRASAPQPAGVFLNFLEPKVTCFILCFCCCCFFLRVQCRGKRVLTSGLKIIEIRSTSMNATVKTRGARWGCTGRPRSGECVRRGRVRVAQPHQTVLGKLGALGAEPSSASAVRCGVCPGTRCSPGWPRPAASRNPGQRDSQL